MPTTVRLTAMERQEPRIIPEMTVSGCMGGNGSASRIDSLAIKYVGLALDCGTVGN